MHACPAFVKREATAAAAACSTSASSRTTKGSEPPSSSTDVLSSRPAIAATLEPARSEPVSVTPRTRGSASMRSTATDVAEDGLERRLREARLREESADAHGAAGDVRRVLEQHDVAGHEHGRREAEHLDIGEVPRHHGDDRPERHLLDPVLELVAVDAPRREHRFGLVGVVLAEPRGLLDLARRLAEDLAHLRRGQRGELVLVRAQRRRESADELGALGDRALAPLEEGVVRAGDGGVDVGGARGVVAAELFAGRGVRCDESHLSCVSTWRSGRKL